MRKVMIIGLDCAEPSLLLERWRDKLPVLSGLMEKGAYGRLTSVIPPITVPAWSCMMSSRTPGDLGVYGFRNRSDYSYDGLFIANSTAIKEPRLWDHATRGGKPSIVLGVPGTYPPRPLNGVMVSCFLTPSVESQYTFPPMLKREIEQTVGEYHFDVHDFRTEDKDYLLRQVHEMTERRFQLAQHLLSTRPWELFAMVEMGVDRMYHGFWKMMDPQHRKHEPGNRYESAILDYHMRVDELMGGLLAHADEDTAVLVVSDHGGKRMDGGIRVNEWLRREGLLDHGLRPADGRPAPRGRGRLVEDGRLGRGRLLLPHLPQRRGPRARGDRPAGRLRAPAPRPRPSGSPPFPTRTATRSTPGFTFPRRPTRGERGRSRPDRPLRRPPLALGRDGRGRRRRSTPSRTTRGRTTPTTPRTASSCSSRPASPPESTRPRTSWTSPRQCWSFSVWTSRARCGARRCCLRARFMMTTRRRGVLGECEARTQGARVFENTGATEDAESRRPGRPGGTVLIVNRAPKSPSGVARGGGPGARARRS